MQDYPGPSPIELIQLHIEGWLCTIRYMAIAVVMGWGDVFASASQWCRYVLGHGTTPYHFWRCLMWDEFGGEGWLYVLKNY